MFETESCNNSFSAKKMQINESAGRKRVVVSYVSSFMHWRRRRDWRDTTARSFKIRFVAQMRFWDLKQHRGVYKEFAFENMLQLYKLDACIFTGVNIFVKFFKDPLSTYQPYFFSF